MSICLGQVLSILIALTGVFTTYLTARKVNIPTTQSLFNYVFLTGNLLLLWWRRRRGGGDGRREYDVNGDGAVTVADILAILSAFGATC